MSINIAAPDGDGFRFRLRLSSYGGTSRSTHPTKCAIAAASVIVSLGGAIQRCCSVKTVTAIPARSRSSTLCESSTPALTLSAVCIP